MNYEKGLQSAPPIGPPHAATLWASDSAHFNESPEELEDMAHCKADAPSAQQIAADFSDIHAA